LDAVQQFVVAAIEHDIAGSVGEKSIRQRGFAVQVEVQLGQLVPEKLRDKQPGAPIAV